MIRPMFIGAMLMLSPGLASGQPTGARDPDWPCQQIKVPRLSLAAVWSGPPVDVNDPHWRDDAAIAELVSKIAPRRVPIDRAQSMIEEFAAHAGDKKQTQLLHVLAGLFNVFDEERSTIIAGLDRFGERQKQLAAQIRQDNEQLRALQTNASSDADALQKLTQQVTWEAEVFQDRSRAISAACDVPGKIEQRLFALAREVQKQLD